MALKQLPRSSYLHASYFTETQQLLGLQEERAQELLVCSVKA